jgi:hypothetical protein
VAYENPQVLLIEVAASLSLSLHAVMPFAGYLWGIFGESYESCRIDSHSMIS